MKRYMLGLVILCLLISNLLFCNKALAFPNIGLKLETSQPTGEKFDVIAIILEDYEWIKTDSEEIISRGDDGFWYYCILEENEIKLSSSKYKIDPKPQNSLIESDLLKWREQKYTSSIKDINLNKASINIEAGQTEQLIATITSDIKPFLENSIVWSSNNNDIATIKTIDSYGTCVLVRAMSPGSVKIKAASKHVPSYYTECEVTVLEASENIKIDSTYNKSIVLLIDHNKAFVNGKSTIIDPTNSSIVPIIKNDKTLLPLRFVSEKLGATVEWDDRTSTAIIKADGTYMKITLGSNIMWVNGEKQILEVPAESIDDRIYIPLRAIVESLGKKVFYDNGLIVISDNVGTIDRALIGRTIKLFDNNQNNESALFPAVLGGKWGYIDNNGKIIIEPQFQDAMEFSDGLAPVAIKGKYGYIDKNGNLIVEPKFDRVWKMSDGMGMVLLNGKCGFVNNSGKLVVEPKYDFGYTTLFSEGLACVGINNKCGFINKSGNIVIEPKFALAFSFSEGLSAVLDKDTNKWGFIDKTGNYVIKPIYISAFPFTEGLAPVQGSTKGNGMWGFIDKTGNYVIKPQFEGASNFKENLAQVRNSLGKAGYIDKKGNLIIDFKFDTAADFSEGLALVSISNKSSNTSKYGYINRKGDLAIDMKFDYATNFNNGLAMVDTGYMAGYINKEGNYIWEPSAYSPFLN